MDPANTDFEKMELKEKGTRFFAQNPGIQRRRKRESFQKMINIIPIHLILPLRLRQICWQEHGEKHLNYPS